jgi:2-isopropylmalate synthase
VQLILGRHSGRRAVEHRLQALGLRADDAHVNLVLDSIKTQPKGNVFTDERLRQIVSDRAGHRSSDES